MASYHAPQEWKEWSDWLATGLDGRSRWQLGLLLMGLVFGHGRRVVVAWIRAAGLSVDDRDDYYFLLSVGHRWQPVGRRLFVLVFEQVLKDQSRVVVEIDDSPTKRDGPQVQGSGIHHDPTPGPAWHPFCYGHIWVTLAVIVRHPLWGTIELPTWSWLYVRAQDVSKIPAQHGWAFQTKLAQALDLVLLAAGSPAFHGKIAVGPDGRLLHQAAVRAAGVGGRRHAGRPIAEGFGAARSSAAGENQAPRPEAKVRRESDL